jgi:hypothetical protein
MLESLARAVKPGDPRPPTINTDHFQVRYKDKTLGSTLKEAY